MKIRALRPADGTTVARSLFTMPTSNAPERTSFQRIEKKFILSRDEGEEFIRLIEAHVPPSYPKNGTEFYDVESLYFDSPNLDIYRAHFQIYDGRFKLRTRTYGPNGIWDRSCVYLEMKMKQRELTQKFRIKLDAQSHAMLFESDEPELPLSRTLIMTNPSLEFRELSHRVQQVDQHLRKLKLKPCSRLSYRRKAYENDEIRITIDENVQSELLLEVDPATRMEISALPLWPDAQRMLSDYPISRGMILEIKNQGSFPEWMNEFVLAHKMTEARFSKFCYSITSNLGNLLSAPLNAGASADAPPLVRSAS
jgi:SPX domain protein involved in polyphosphate accumulation